MSEGAQVKGFRRWAVATSFAVSLVAFLATCSIRFSQEAGPFSAAWPILIAGQLCAEGLASMFTTPTDLTWLWGPLPLAFLLLLGFLGLCGIVFSVRQPNRLGWFVCGHTCLLVYYVICVELVGTLLEAVHC